MSEQPQPEIPEYVVMQLARVRYSGRVGSMFDLAAVQAEAHEVGLRHLWSWLENLRNPDRFASWDTEVYGKALEASTYIGLDEHGRPTPLDHQDFTGL